MAFEQVTANKLVGFMSPEQMALANNTFGIDHLTNASSDDDVGVVKAPMSGKARVVVRASAAYASGETLALSILYRGAAGALVAVPLVTAGPTNVTAAGEFVLLDNLSVDAIMPGALIQVRRVYTAGGGPANPEVAIVLQLY